MIILLDVDKTLVDEEYELTDDRVPAAVAAAFARGHLVGLSSDTPFLRLRELATRLGMKGPIIAERGAILAADGCFPVPTGSAPSWFFQNLRLRVLQRLMNEGMDVIACDPAEIRRTRRYRTDGEERRVVLVNALRTYSLMVSTFRIRGDTYVADAEAVDALVQMIHDELRRCSSVPKLDWDVNCAQSLVIVHSDATRKAFGMECVRLAHPYAGNYIVIGDGANDFTGLSWVDHWAVGNASDTYKSQCTRVASAAYAAGVVELLSTLS
jgi:hydroxymethylpyrimidine pyrophosphatase-like HAD family hydrolase